ncbi:MAG: hypothetical protein JWL83_2827 [Actinomycetia bacterium]|nr:hypothetical protein [Actinomycetes bacterium]
MARKRTVVFASGIGTGLIAFSALFALANGVFSNGKADAVGTFRPVNVKFAPTIRSAPRTTVKTTPAPSLTAPNTSPPATAAAPAQSSSPRATSIAAPTSPNTFAPAPTSSGEWPSTSATPAPSTTVTTHELDDHKPDDGRLSDD